MADYQHDIEKYLKGELTPAERHALEKKALSDPFLADALEGAEQIEASSFSNDVAELNKKFTTQKGNSIWIWPMRIAAGVALVVASSYIIWLVLENQPESQQLALEKNERVIPQSSTTDSIRTGDLDSQIKEQPASGPTASEKDIASKSTYPSKAEAKPTQPVITEPIKESLPDAVIAEEAKAEDLKVTEAIAQTRVSEKESEELKVKTEDVQRAKKLSLAQDDKRRDANPTAGAAINGTTIIRGKVTSAEDGSPLPGINVIIKGSTIGTATDVAGNYQIEIQNPNPVLQYSFIGLQSKEVVPGDRTEVDVSMSLDVTQLSEVVVTGYGGSNSPAPTLDLAHPENGYRNFKQYLQQNVRYPEQAKVNKVEGRVTVEFTVEANGSLTNFKVIRGIGSGCDEELIRLIKEGTVWIPTKKDGVPVQDKAKVRLKFELPK